MLEIFKIRKGPMVKLLFRKCHFIFIFLFIFPLFAHAQEHYDSLRSIYVKSFPNYFNAKLLGTDRLLILNLVGKNEGSKKLNFAPNDRGYIGIGTYIFDVGLEFSVKVPTVFQRSKQKYGKTDFIDFQGNVYGNRWCVDATFQKYQGFYISNASNIFPDFDSKGDYPQRRDLTVMNIILNGIHIFNHQKFSFRAGFNQADKQIKSAGSPILLLSATRFSIKSDSLIVPGNIQEDFGEAGSLREGAFVTFSVLPGYAYNFVLHNFFINLNATGGIGLQHQHYKLDETFKSKLSVEPKLNFRASLGYDNERFFAGGSFVLQKSKINIEEMRINNTAGNYKFFVGYRFKEFGILKKFSVRDLLK